MVTCHLTFAIVTVAMRLLPVDGASVKIADVVQLVVSLLLLLQVVTNPRRAVVASGLAKKAVRVVMCLPVAVEPLKMALGKASRFLRSNLLVMASTGLVLSGEVDSKGSITITVEHMSMTAMSSS